MLKDQGYEITNNFLSANFVREVRNDLLAARERGRFKPAGVGKDATKNKMVRGDEIMWLDDNSTNPVHMALLKNMDDLRNKLNREHYLGLRTFEGHYAYYPPSGFYEKHKDRFRDDDSRTISLVLYLNEDWQERHGGKLRLYTSGDYLDIAPQAGTLALFLSDLEHEVLESHAPRLTFTGWFKK